MKQEANKAIEKFKEKTGVTVPTEVVNAIEGVDVNQVTSVFKDKCAKESGSDGAYQEVEVSLKFENFTGMFFRNCYWFCPLMGKF